MNIKRGLIFATVLALSAAFAYEQYPGMRELTGQYDITGKTAVDPKPTEPRNTHLRIFLVGSAAKTLYENMDVEPKTHLCGATDGPVKIIDSMMCESSADDDGYKCWFAIDIANQKIDGGWAC